MDVVLEKGGEWGKCMEMGKVYGTVPNQTMARHPEPLSETYGLRNVLAPFQESRRIRNS